MATNECSAPTQQQPLTSSKKTRFPEAAIPDLIRLIHGNTYSKRCLVKEFMAYWSKKNKGAKNQPSKASIQQKIREIGKWMPCPEKGPMHSKACWYVDENVRKEHINEELPLPNCWSYILSPKKKSDITKIRLFFSPKWDYFKIVFQLFKATCSELGRKDRFESCLEIHYLRHLQCFKLAS